ncbi:MAG TPA: NUDIX domain-containing protein [Candidatus Limnocylindrales bacterium]|nr:NUDIX domain-containing protein [Candidatus Limnocylindrales bacterium]
MALLLAAKAEVSILGPVPLDLDWALLSKAWASDSVGRPRVSILMESDNQLFSRSFFLDSEASTNRRTFRELLFIRDEAMDHLASAGLDHCVRVLHVAAPITAVLVDGRLFVAAWLDDVIDSFEELERTSALDAIVRRYLETVFGPVGAKYASEAGEELLELFDHNRISRGIFPRRSFYDTDYSQLVVWALIFDRSGKLLIHRRADNAADNRGMWDKSVGGHVDFSLDVDTSRAVIREVVEELFSDEVKERSRFTAWTVTDADIIYCGEWRPEKRRSAPFNEIAPLRREWAFFRLRDGEAVYSPRELPDGTVRRLRVIADIYLFVAGPGMSEETLGDLANSEYKLIELSDLRSAMDRSVRGDGVIGFDRRNAVPRFTPDLINILTGRLRDTLEDFAQYVKRYCK